LGQNPRFRGHDLKGLVESKSVREVASLIWTGSFSAPLSDVALHAIQGGSAPPELSFRSRAISVLPIVAASDTQARERSRRARAQTGWRIVNLLASIAADSPELEGTIEATLARAWNLDPEAENAIRRALIVSACAPVTNSLTAAGPYETVIAGLALFTPAREHDAGATLLAGRKRSLFAAMRLIERRHSMPKDAGMTILLIGRAIAWIGALEGGRRKAKGKRRNVKLSS
jgi:hypothetical protein